MAMRLLRGSISYLLIFIVLGLSASSVSASPTAPFWNNPIVAADSDGDGIPDDMDPDDDNDGISDANEGNPGAPPDNAPIPDDDKDTIPDDLDPDDNNNGVTDEDEASTPANGSTGGGGSSGGGGNNSTSNGSNGAGESNAVTQESSATGGPLQISALPVTGSGPDVGSGINWIMVLSMSSVSLLMALWATSRLTSPPSSVRQSVKRSPQ